MAWNSSKAPFAHVQPISQEHDFPPRGQAPVEVEAFLKDHGPIHYGDSSKPAVWREKVLRLGPLVGMLALVVAAATIPASLGILIACRDSVTASWRFQPTVLLNILSALCSATLATAGAQGAVIAWWKQALRGTSLKKLYWNWTGMSGVSGAVTALASAHFDLFTITPLFVILAAICGGPLLQRAVETGIRYPFTTIQVSITPEIPSNSTGILDLGSAVDWAPMSPAFLPVVDGLVKSTAMNISMTSASGVANNGSYQTTVLAPALQVHNCSSQAVPRNYSGTPNTSFMVDVGFSALRETNTETVLVQIGRSDNQAAETCAGTYNVTRCEFVPIVANYSIQIQNGNATFLTPPSQAQFVDYANNTFANLTNRHKEPCTLCGVSAGCALLYNAFTNISNTLGSTQPVFSGATPFVYKQTPNIGAVLSGTACLPQWNDPTNDLLDILNELMFRAALAATSQPNVTLAIDPKYPVTYAVGAQSMDPETYFRVTFWYFLASALPQAIVIALVACRYTRWWELGRDTSFHPLEVARAFGAPLLADVNSNTEMDGLAKALRDQQVRYGVLNARDGSPGRVGASLGFAGVGQASKPPKRVVLVR